MAQPCPHCDDTGLRMIERGGNRFAVECACRVERRESRMLANAEIPERFKECTLESFIPSYQGPNPSLEAASLQARNFVKNYHTDTGHRGRGILFTGPHGTGKTHLAVGMIRELISCGVQCKFVTYGELLKQIQNSYNPTARETELDILRPVFKAEILVIDELGWTKPSEWVWDTVAHILNSRYNDLRTTLITTNFPNVRQFIASDLEKVAPAARDAWLAMYKETLGDRIGERMRSRLQEMCITVEMTANDFRETKAGRANFAQKRKYTANELFDLRPQDQELMLQSSDSSTQKPESSKRLPLAQNIPKVLIPQMDRNLQPTVDEWTQERLQQEVDRATAAKEYRDLFKKKQ